MPEAHKRNINPKYKKSYKNENRDWSQYDRSLRNRGDITIWFSQEAIKAWTPKPKGNPGRQRIYSELAIETVLTLRLLFHLPLRQAEGFVNSIIALMGLELSTPDHPLSQKQDTETSLECTDKPWGTTPCRGGQHRSFHSWRGTMVSAQTRWEKKKRMAKIAHYGRPEWADSLHFTDG